MSDSWPWPKMFLCSIATTIPLLIGWHAGHLAIAIFGGLLGYMLALNDSPGPLIKQRYFHFTATILILTTGLLLGVSLSDQPVIAKLVLFALTYSLGLMGAQGTEFELSLLFTVFLFLVGLYTPALVKIETGLLMYAGLGYLTVLVGSALLARWPMQGKSFSPYVKTFNFLRTNELNRHLYAFVFALTVMASDFLIEAYQIDHGYWVVGAVLIIMRPDHRLSVQRSIGRLVGTVIGVGVATGIVQLLTHQPIVLISIIAIATFFVPATINKKYWLTSALMGIVVLLLLDMASGQLGTTQLAVVRVETTAIGCGITLLGITLFSFLKRMQIKNDK